MLVPAPATVQRGQRYDRSRAHSCILITGRMHANYDMETVTCMHGLNDGEIRFTLVDVIFRRS